MKIKSLMMVILIIGAMLISILSIGCTGEPVGGVLIEGTFTVTLNEEGDSYRITSYIGIAKDVVIPEVHEGIKITIIDEGLFANNSYIETVTISKNIITIGSYAFDNCVNLETVIFNENSELETIKTYAFRNCTGLKNILIPESVTNVEEGAFYGCTSLIIL